MSANRVMKSVTRFIEGKLGLKVNVTKSKITKPKDLKYLGFGFYYDKTMCIWKHWKTPQNRIKNLIKLGVPKWEARRTGYAKGYARVCRASDICQAISNKRLAQFELISMLDYYTEKCTTC